MLTTFHGIDQLTQREPAPTRKAAVLRAWNDHPEYLITYKQAQLAYCMPTTKLPAKRHFRYGMCLTGILKDCGVKQGPAGSHAPWKLKETFRVQPKNETPVWCGSCSGVLPDGHAEHCYLHPSRDPDGGRTIEFTVKKGEPLPTLPMIDRLLFAPYKIDAPDFDSLPAVTYMSNEQTRLDRNVQDSIAVVNERLKQLNDAKAALTAARVDAAARRTLEKALQWARHQVRIISPGHRKALHEALNEIINRQALRDRG